MIPHGATVLKLRQADETRLIHSGQAL